MTNRKIVALAAFVALPVACSRDRRDTETPEGMTPASGYSEPGPINPTAPGPMQDPIAPAAPEPADTIGVSDTDATATGGTGTGGGGGSTSGGSTGGTGKGRGGSSTGGTNARDAGM
jgi:hypothetical protein